MDPLKTAAPAGAPIEALRDVLLDTRSIGPAFFADLVVSLARVLRVRWALVAELVTRDGRQHAITRAFSADGALIGPFEYDPAETPCHELGHGQPFFQRSGVLERFPRAEMLRSFGAEAYLGVPLLDANGEVLGHLALLHDAAIDESLDPSTVLSVFAVRAGAEIERLRRMQESLRHRDQLMLAVGYAAQRLLGAAHWRDCMVDILARIGSSLGARRVLATETRREPDGTPRGRVRFEWVRPGTPRLMDSPQFSDYDIAAGGYARWFQELAAGRALVGPAELTSDEVDLMRHIDVAAIIQLPVSVDGELWGSISISDDQVRDWSAQDAQILRAVADSLATAIQRERARDALLALNAELEARVFQRTAALDAANRELEAFCYSVSHDLRAPLRHIEGFGAALGDVLRTSGDPQEAHELLARLREATRHTDQLIRDLLELSRVTRSVMSHERVDLSMLSNLISEELQRGAPERQVEWRIQPGIYVSGDVALLNLALRNLLENAWKYSRQRERARIEVASERHEGETVIAVRDNGAGFDPRHADRLFAAFQRLHQQEEFEGHGIGLATVQRIVHRHGGRIWGEGQVGEGAVFRIVLPGA